jgi:exodeoxyribonuclease VII large subunit
VASAIVHSAIPVISAVGHETDETISDLVADMRAATPTHAAVLATPVTVDDLVVSIDDARMRMTRSIVRRIDDARALVMRFLDGSAMRRLQERLHQRQQRVDELTMRFDRSVRQHIARQRQLLDHAVTLLATLHPLSPLRRGFAVLERDGTVIRPSDAVHPGEHITIRRATQLVGATVETTTNLDPIAEQHHENVDEISRNAGTT